MYIYISTTVCHAAVAARARTPPFIERQQLSHLRSWPTLSKQRTAAPVHAVLR